MDAQKHIPTAFPSLSPTSFSLRQGCRDAAALLPLRRHLGVLAKAGTAVAGTRLVLMLHPALGLWRDGQSGPSAAVVCRTQAPASQELGQATKKQTF